MFVRKHTQLLRITALLAFASAIPVHAQNVPNHNHGGGDHGGGDHSGDHSGDHAGGDHGGGGMHPPPSPSPTPAPTPAPTPTPTPDPTPAPVGPSPDQARSEGNSDGQSDGAREGAEKGAAEGRDDGRREGFRAGFDRCQREERQRAHDAGYGSGFRAGTSDGNNAGNAQGLTDGTNAGRSDGNTDGLRRADADANAASEDPGTARGIAEANASNASQQGRYDGLAAGDRDANKDAVNNDYPRGRKDYYNERFAEAVNVSDSFSQRPVTPVPLSAMSLSNALALFERSGPSYSYSNPRRSYPTPEANSAYQGGYRSGYQSGFSGSYSSAYDSAYKSEYPGQQESGCRDARSRSYAGDYNDGKQEGYNRGYRSAYDSAYASARSVAYQSAFQNSSASAYSGSYNDDYQQHFEEWRSHAYRSRYNDLYNAAFQPAHDGKYAQVYPSYAQREYTRGRSDEAADFSSRPVRLLAAQVTETIPNGVFEPDETLRVKLKLRNFADSNLAGRDVKLVLTALDSPANVISESQATLVRDLRAKSETIVTDALEFRLPESAVGSTRTFKLTAFYQDRNVGELTLSVQPKFMLDVQLAEPPSLHEGLPAPVKVRVTNQSQVASDGAAQLSFVTDSKLAEITKATLGIGSLAPGESRVVEYTVTARTYDTQISLPMGLVASTGAGRRVGVLDSTGSVPVLNDYKIELTGNVSAKALRAPGVVRLRYALHNVSSRLLFKGLQLQVHILGDAANKLEVIGPNPQFLSPMLRGQTAEFSVPVMVKGVSGGGTLELTVQEDGVTVVVHQIQF